jgi:nucleoid DNA-binding protein
MAQRKSAKKSAGRGGRSSASSRSSAGKVKPKIRPRVSDKPRTKSEIYRDLSDTTGLSRKQVVSVFEGLSGLVKKDVGKSGPGTFSIPGLVKLVTVHKPATQARKGINPFTGEETTFKARPARTVIKARPLKALKDMA